MQASWLPDKTVQNQRPSPLPRGSFLPSRLSCMKWEHQEKTPFPDSLSFHGQHSAWYTPPQSTRPIRVPGPPSKAHFLAHTSSSVLPPAGGPRLPGKQPQTWVGKTLSGVSNLFTLREDIVIYKCVGYDIYSSPGTHACPRLQGGHTCDLSAHLSSMSTWLLLFVPLNLNSESDEECHWHAKY